MTSSLAAFGRMVMVCGTVISAAVAGVREKPSAGQPTQLPDCLPNVADDSSTIHARIAAVQADPAAVLPKIELARCFDLTWQVEQVEQAVLQAQEAFEAELAAKPPGQSERGAPPLAGADVPTPQRLTGNPPQYPNAAREDGAAGIVIVEARIDREGRVRDARVARSVKGLDSAALRAVEQWRYARPTVSGQPADVRVYLPIEFGHVTGQQPADLLEIAAFYYGQGLHQLVRSALLTARTAARAELVRYGRVHNAQEFKGHAGFAHPAPLKQFVPRYTARAMREKVMGDVELDLLIDRQGTVGRASIIKPLPYLNIPALQTAMLWQFKPATLDGQPLSVIARLMLTFRLYGEPEKRGAIR
jgi:TonB family protein